MIKYQSTVHFINAVGGIAGTTTNLKTPKEKNVSNCNNMHTSGKRRHNWQSLTNDQAQSDWREWICSEQQSENDYLNHMSLASDAAAISKP